MTYSTPEWIAWLAGLIEGEGTVAIARSSRQTGYRYGVQHRCLVQIANTDGRLIERACDVIAAITGKRPKPHGVKRYAENQRPGLAIHVTTSWEIAFLIPAVRPWLVTKADQADIVLSFSKRHVRSGSAGARTQETFDLDELDYARCRLLNRRGNHGGPDIEEMERMVVQADQKEQGDERCH